MSPAAESPRWREIRRLRRARPRQRFLRWSLLGVAVLAVYVWLVGDFDSGSLLAERRQANLLRFLGELVPHPLQGRPWDWGVAWSWLTELMAEKGWSGAAKTLSISVVAIVLAALGGLVLSLPAARSWASSEPWLPEPRPPGRLRRLGWAALVAVTRTVQVVVRSIPEYVWAFLLLALLGPNAWPAVLALAIHNAGILGKLDAEVVENLPPATLATLRGLGGRRRQIAAVAILPLALPRLLLLFFYRWETCVREATVLGMLGIVSLGFWIQDARARNHYDDMFFLILLGAALVLAGDLLSAVARRAVRRGGMSRSR